MAHTLAQLQQAQHDYDQAKAVYCTKQRHYNVLVAQMNELTNNNNDNDRGDTNRNLLSRQISIFRPFLLEAKAKMNECELQLHDMMKHEPR